jgi:hypothetical protein
MDKTMKRQVLFDKKSAEATTAPVQKPTKKEEKPAVKVKEVKPTKKTVTKAPLSMVEWLKVHDLIKFKPLCVKAKIDPATFHRWVNIKGELPIEAIKKLTPILKDYGFDDSI